MTEPKHSPLPWIQVALHPRTILGAGQHARHAFRIEPEDSPGFYGRLEAIQRCEANAALAVRSVNALPEVVAVLQRYMAAYPAFRIKPVGAPWSEKRTEQEMLMDLEGAAQAAIAKAERGE